MNTKSTSCLVAAVVALLYVGVGQPTPGQAGGLPLVEVLQLQVSMKGVQQEQNGEIPVIGKVTVTADILINLALGRPIANPVGPNEVLGLVACSEGPPLIIVFDTENEIALATLAYGDSIYSADDFSKSAFLAIFDIPPTGDENNGLTGGFLVLTGGSTEGEGCPTSISGTLVGVLQGVSTDEFTTEPFEIVINKGKASAKAPPIGFLLVKP